MNGLIDGSIVVTLDETKRAMRVLAEKARVIAEGAGALRVAAALTGKAKSDGPIVAVVSGGNVDSRRSANSSARSRRRPHKKRGARLARRLWLSLRSRAYDVAAVGLMRFGSTFTPGPIVLASVMLRR